MAEILLFRGYKSEWTLGKYSCEHLLHIIESYSSDRLNHWLNVGHYLFNIRQTYKPIAIPHSTN